MLSRRPPPWANHRPTICSVSPARSAGGQRRYSSRQLDHARRLVDLVAEGLSLQAAARITALEDEVAVLRARLEPDAVEPT